MLFRSAKSAKAAADRDARLAAERMAARAQATLQAETERIRAEAAAKLEREIAELRAKALSAPPAPKMPDVAPVSDGRVQPAVDISKVRELPWKTMAMAASVVLVLGAAWAGRSLLTSARVKPAQWVDTVSKTAAEAAQVVADRPRLGGLGDLLGR